MPVFPELQTFFLQHPSALLRQFSSLPHQVKVRAPGQVWGLDLLHEGDRFVGGRSSADARRRGPQALPSI
jgi:hypothetical protein